ncbi:MAG: response regulator transcription factor [Bacteroidetes bacterium]|nr:response regulator transcription factor [Bacteroidota bacterium]
MQRKILNKNSYDYFNIIEQSEVIIVDISSSDKKDPSLMNYVNEIDERIPVIALDSYTERVYADSILKKGASAYLPFSCFADELEDALSNVLQDRSYISKRICTQ